MPLSFCPSRRDRNAAQHDWLDPRAMIRATEREVVLEHGWHEPERDRSWRALILTLATVAATALLLVVAAAMGFLMYEAGRMLQWLFSY